MDHHGVLWLIDPDHEQRYAVSGRLDGPTNFELTARVRGSALVR